MSPRYKAPHVPAVDYRQLLDWITRHNGGDHYAVARRFAEHYNLPALAHLRLERLLREYKAQQKAHHETIQKLLRNGRGV